MQLKFDFSFRRIVIALLLVLSFASLEVKAQNCTVNAGIPENICPGNPMVLKGKFTGLFLNGSNASWSQVGGPAVTIGTPVISGSDITANVTGYSPGNVYTFRITARCADGSQIFQDVVFTTLAATKANAGSNITSCAGVVTLAGNTPALPGETGDWSITSRAYGVAFTGTSSSPTAKLVLPNDTSSQVTLKWTIISTNGCASASSITLTNNSGQSPVTAGTNQTLSNCYTLTTGTSLFSSYGGSGLNGQQGTWSFVSGPSTPTFSDIHNNRSGISNLVEGVYRIRWTVAGPCVTGSSEMTITVPAPTQSVTGVGSIDLVYCDSRTATVLTGPTPAFTNETSTWTLVSGTGTISAPNSPSTDINGLTPPSSSVFQYTIKNTATGCTSTGTYRITYLPNPTITATTGPIIILSSTATAVSIPYTTTGGNQTYWQLLTAPTGSTLAASGTTTYQYIDASPIDLTGLDKIGNYNFRLQRTTVNAGTGGCANAFADITVVISQPHDVANAGTATSVQCNVFTSVLAGNSPVVGAGYWSQVSGPTTAVIANPYTAVTTLSNLTNGGYIFRWIITGGQGATDAQSDVLVRVASIAPTTSNAGSNRVVCNQTPVTMAANAAQMNEIGTWTVTPSSGVTFVDINNPTTKVTGLADNTSYTFTWTISNSCNISASNVIISTSAIVGPKAAIAGSPQCLSGTATTFTLAGNAPTGTETGTWSLISGPNTPTIVSVNSATTNVTGAVSGTYVFQWALSTPSCTATTDAVTITASATATAASVTSTLVNLCGATSIVLAGNTALVGTGSWTQVGGPGGATITDPSSPTSTVTGLISASYIFRWTISNGACSSNYVDVKYNISTPPTTPVVTGDIAVCGGTSTTLNGNTITAGTGLWQLLSGPNTPTFSSFTNPTASLSGLTTGTYQLLWTAANGVNCPISKSAAVNIVVTQAATASVTSSGLCNATVVQLTGNNGSSGAWTTVSGSPAPTLNQNSGFTAIATNLGTSTYVFKYTLPAVGGCAATSATVSISVTAAPSAAQAGIDQVLCNAVSTTLAASPATSGTGTWTILSQPDLSAAGFTNSHSPTTNMTSMIPGVYLLQWNIVSGNCGSNADIVRITTSALPTTSVAGTNQLTACTGTLTLNGNTPTVGIGTWTQVTSMSGTIDAPNSPSSAVIGAVPGSYVFKWTIANGSCAASSSTVSITVTSTPPNTANAGPDQSICNLGPTATATLAGSTPVLAETGVWTIASKPVGASPTFTNASLYNTQVSNLIAGTYQFTWTVSNGSCSSYSTVTITVTDNPTTANAGPDKSICLYTPVTLAATAVTTGVGTWSTFSQPAGSPDPVFDDVNLNTTGVNGLIAGDYIFKWVSTNGAGCASSMSSVTIHIVQPPTAAQAGSYQTVCLGVNPTMTANSPTYGVGTWTLTTSAGGTPAFSDVHAYNTAVTGLVAGVYTFSWTITNGGCTSVDGTQITVLPAIAANAIATPQTICSGSTPVAFTGTTVTGGTGTYTYQWESSTTSAVAGFSNINGATSATYGPGSLTTTTWYRRTVSSGACSAVNFSTANSSGPLQVTVQTPIANNIATTPTTATFCGSGDATPIVGTVPTGGDNTTYTYQWEQSVTGATSGFTTIVGETNADYDPPLLTVSTWFRRIVTSGSCNNTSLASKITINPYATLTSSQPSPICNATVFTYSPTASITATAFSWTRATIASINSGASGSGSGSISETLTNSSAVPVDVQYLYQLTTPTGCTNPVSYSVTVRVNPTTTVDQPADQVVCKGTNITAVTFTGSPVANTVYSWTATKSIGVGMPLTGTASLTAYQASNTTNAALISVITVTPMSNTCNGATVSFSITVNPVATLNAINPTAVCTGLQFSVTPANVTNGIVPAGTTYSWGLPSMASGLSGGATGSGSASINGTLVNSVNGARTAVYIVTPHTVACGDGPTFTVTATINPVAAVNDMAITSCAGVAFSPTPADVTNGVIPSGTKYAWSAPSGSGFTGGAANSNQSNISGTLTNSAGTITAVAATYKVTPTSGTCVGAQFTLTVTISPKALPASMSTTICSGVQFTQTPTNGVNGTIPPSTTFSWTASGTSLTGLSAGSGTDITATLSNTSNVAQIAVYTVIPSTTGCTGNTFSVSVTVNPIVNITTTQFNSTICTGANFSVVPVNGVNGIVPASTQYTWSAPTMTVPMGGTAASNASSISGTLVNTTSSTQTATYVVTPSVACGSGAPFTVVVSVTPKAVINPLSTTVCGGIGFSFSPADVTDGVVPAGTKYTWSAPTINGFSGGASGSAAATISGTLTNTIATATTASYLVTPSFGGCTGPVFSITININPKAIINQMTNLICNGSSFNSIPNATNGIVPAGTIYSWNAPGGSGFSLGVAGSGTSISGTLANGTSSAHDAIYSVTTLSGTCVGNPFTLTVTVNPIAVINSLTATSCSGTLFEVTPTDNTADGVIPAGTLYSWSALPTGTGFTGGMTATLLNSVRGVLVNTTTSNVTAVYIVTPSSAGCTGNPFTVTVTIKPSAAVNALSTTVCGGSLFTVLPNDGTDGRVPPATTYSWPTPANTGFTGGASLSGQSDIRGTLTNTTSNAVSTVYTVTPTTGGCTGASFSVTVTINPLAQPNNMTTVICSGATFTSNPTGIVPSGTTYTWTVANANGVLGTASGGPSTAITGTLTNPTNAALTATYNVTPNTAVCGAGKPFSVSVGVAPIATIAPMSATSCAGVMFDVTPTSAGGNILPSGTVYTWSLAPTGTGFTGGATRTNATSITGLLTNTTSSQVTATYLITPSTTGAAGTCAGSVFSVTIYLNPKAITTPVSPAAICSGTAFAYTPTDGVGGFIIPSGTQFSWSTPSAPGIAGAASGSNLAGVFGTLTNSVTTARTIVYTVTSSSPTGSCVGNPFTITVTVNPVAVLTSTTNPTAICSGTSFSYTGLSSVAGSTFAWSRIDAANVTASGSGTGATAVINQTLTNSNAVPAAVKYVYTLTANGCTNPLTYTVNALVNPTLTLNGISDQVLCSGTTTAGVTFSVSPAVAGTTYNWTNTASGIGLALTGTGTTISSFTALNSTGTPLTGVITVRAMSNSCSSATQSFSITVNPTPAINAISAQTICAGTLTTAVTFAVTPAVSGVTYNWTNTSSAIGLALTGTGNSIPAFTGTNITGSPISGVITVAAMSNACTSATKSFTITVNPTSTPDVIADQVVCSGTLTNAVTFNVTPSVAGVVYNWTNTASGMGLALTGTGSSIPAFTALNATGSPITALITVRAVSNTCVGATQTFSITVNPTPSINTISAQTICAGTLTTAVNFAVTPSVSGVTYNWTNTSSAIGLALTGTGNSISAFTGTNITGSPISGVITVAAMSNACTSATKSFTITVNPTSTPDVIADQVVCSGTLTNAVTFSVTPAVAGITYTWTNTNNNIGLALTGNGAGIAAFTATNATSAPITAMITVKAISNTCAGATKTFSITVNPTATLTSSLTPTAICSGASFAYSATSAVSGAVLSWSRTTVAGISSAGAATGTGDINEVLVNGNNVQTSVGYVYTITANGCTNPLTYTVTIPVNAIATINTLTATICGAGSFTLTPNGTNGIVPAGTTYKWLAPSGTGFSGGASETTGTASITGTLLNTGNAAATATYTVTPTSGTCVGTAFTVVVSINPTPIVSAMTTTVCTGFPFNVTPVNGIDGIIPLGTTYTWTAPTGINISGSAQMSASAGITGSPVNSVNVARTATYMVTPVSGSCTGAAFSVTILINPVAAITSMTGSGCGGVTFTVNPVNGTNGIVPAGTTYSWGMPAVTGGLTGGTTGSGSSSISGALTNPTSQAQTATYTVTPFTLACGSGATFTVTVSICSGVSINAITATTCSGTAFTVSPVDGVNGIVPAGTTYSWSAPTGTGFTGGISGSGQSSISGTLVNTTVLPVTATYVVTPNASGFTGASFTVTVTINPIPVISSTPTPAAICNNTLFSYIATSATPGVSYAWSRTTPAGITSGGAATGVTSVISETLGNSTALPVSVDYVYTLSANGCTSAISNTVTVIVNPTPVLTSTLTPATIYNGSTFSYTATSATPGTTYTWTRAAITDINGATAASGTGAVINEILANANVAAITVTYVINLSANGCTNAQTVTVSVSSTPGLSSTQTPAAICSGTVFAYTATSSTPGTTYTWTRASIGSINGGATGSGSNATISETLTNSSNAPVSVVYSVILTANGFSNTQNVTVVVNPTPTVAQPADQVICNNGNTTTVTFTGAVAGTGFAWTNNTTSIGLAAAGSGTINAFSATNVTGAPVTALITVTPISNTCAGTPKTFSITVNPTPSVNGVADQVVGNGTATTTVTFSGSPVANTVYNWTNSLSSIGLAASGSGTINAFTATNASVVPVTGIVTVTPMSNSCPGTPIAFSITVNPTPTVTPPTDRVVCNGTTVTPVTFTGSGVANTVYSWTNSDPSIGLAASGTGNIAAFSATNITGVPVTAYVTVTPMSNNNNGVPRTFSITVNPTTSVNPVADQVVCNGTLTSAISFSGSGVANTVYNWTNTAASIGLALTGTGNIAAFTASASGVPVTAYITVTPMSNSCAGSPVTFSVTVNPTPSVTRPVDQVVCNGSLTNAINFSGSTVANTVYNWTNTATSIGLAVSGTGNIAAFTATNASAVPVTAYVTVTPMSNSCAGVSATFSVTINPTPVLSSVLTPAAVCTGNAFTYTATTATSGTTLTWSRTTVTGIVTGGPATGTGDITAQSLSNTTPAPINMVYVYTLTANGCSNVQQVTVAVNPTPTLSSTFSPTAVFGGTAFVYTPTSNTTGTTFSWTRATLSTINNPGTSGTGTINEALVNNSASPVDVTYIYTLTANGCTYAQSVTVSIIPSNIDAVNDDFSAVCVDGAKGGRTASVLANDILNSTVVDPTLVNMTIINNGGITGLTIDSIGRLVIPARTFEGTYTITYNICVTANPGNCDQATVTVKICRGLLITTTAICNHDVPYVHYKVEPNFTPATTNPVTLKWLNGDKSVLTAQPIASGVALEADVLWPGATVDSAGNPTDWPGWFIQNGIWVAGADGFEGTRPNAYLVVSVNPTDTVLLSYPPATPGCATNPVNRPPVAVNDVDSSGQCSATTLNVLSNDYDFEGGVLTVSLPSATSAHGGTMVVNPAGTITYTPASSFSGTDTFMYTITDAAGATASATVTITVAAKPVITGGIAGPCALPRDSTKVFSVTDVPGATGYVWTLPTGWSGTSTTSSISVTPGLNNGIITVTPYKGVCAGTPATFNVSVIDFAKVTIGSTPTNVKGDDVSTSLVTIQLMDPNGNPIHCSGGIATLCTSSGTFTNVVDHGDGTYTAYLRSSANSAIICGSVSGVKIQQTVTTEFSGPQGSIKGNGPIFETETPLLTFNFTAGIGPFTVIYQAQGSNKTDTLTNVTSNVPIPVKSISATKLYTMVSIIGSDSARRDNNFTRDTATIVVVEPKILITLTADNPKFVADNLYSTVLRMKVKNIGEINLASVQVRADLKNVFPNPVQFILDSVKQTGIQTVPNQNYDGINNLDLFSWNSTPGKRNTWMNTVASVRVPMMANGENGNGAASMTDGETADNKHIDVPFLPGYTSEKENETAPDGPMNTPFFFGALSKLDVGEEGQMQLYVRIIPNGYYKPFVMQAVAVGTGHTEFGTALANSLSNDNGNEGLHPEVTHTGDPLPTVINVFPNPVLGVALKASTPVQQVNGTYNVTLTYVLHNYGNVNLRSLTLKENLLRSIGLPSTFNVVGIPTVTGNLIANPTFDAKTDTNMLAANSDLAVDGESTVTYTINITPNQVSSIYRLQATGTGFSSELSTTVTDLSTNGSNPDPDGNLIPDEKLITVILINGSIPPLVPGTIGIKDGTGTVLIKSFCNPTAVTVIPTSLNTGGLDPYTYQWQTSTDNVTFTNIAGATDSTYTTGVIAASVYLRRIVISADQQAFSNSVRVVINSITKPVITASGPLNLTQSGSITLTSSASTSYLWSTNATTQSIVVNTAGPYKVTITDNNGCSATSDLVAINPPPPTTVNRTYIVGASTNPLNSGNQVTGLPGATLNYYLLSTGGVLIAVPAIPNIVGVFTYYVSQTVNGYESVLVPYTVTMLAPNKVADVLKTTPKAPELQADGSYLVGFTIQTSNLRAEQLDSVKVKDDLTKVFPATVKFEVVSVQASGKLIANPSYDGNTQLELLSDGSVLPPSQKDSIQLLVRIYPNGFSGQLNNTAILVAKSPYGTFSVSSNDPTIGDGSVTREPTRFVIPAIDIFIPNGFSPNRDGVNDVFVITRPYNTNISLEIFNRWGNLVYRSGNYQNDWNGKGNQPNNILGEDLPDGTYYYIVIATDKTTGTTRKFAAAVTLKR